MHRRRQILRLNGQFPYSSKSPLVAFVEKFMRNLAVFAGRMCHLPGEGLTFPDPLVTLHLGTLGH